jgi:formylglycine-generating enzyme required for sulfatase activity
MLRYLLICLLSFESGAAEFIKILLLDGTELAGHCRNTSVTVHSSYGSIAISQTNIAEIVFGVGNVSDLIITTFGDRFSGYVNDALEIEIESRRRNLRRFDLARMHWRTVSETSASYVILHSGDIVSGDLIVSSFKEAAALSPKTIEPNDIDSIWFRRSEPTIDVQLKSGKHLECNYSSNAIAIRPRAQPGTELLIGRGQAKMAQFRPAHPSITVATNASSGSTPPVNMVWISPASFKMGSPLDERGRNSDEGPITQIIISRGYWISKYEVTQGEYRSVMGSNPSTFHGETNRPVEKVSWQEANEYCLRLTQQAKEQGSLQPEYVYRLPTEAEWEYACRAGSSARFSFGDDPEETEIGNYAWHVSNSGWTTHPVGQLRPNAWGLFDMHGNVLEWCAGVWNDAYPGGQMTDYRGPAKGWLRVARGGSWLYGASFARSANRDDYGASTRCSDVGFRVVLGPSLNSGL